MTALERRFATGAIDVTAFHGDTLDAAAAAAANLALVHRFTAGQAARSERKAARLDRGAGVAAVSLARPMAAEGAVAKRIAAVAAAHVAIGRVPALEFAIVGAARIALARIAAHRDAAVRAFVVAFGARAGCAASQASRPVFSGTAGRRQVRQYGRPTPRPRRVPFVHSALRCRRPHGSDRSPRAHCASCSRSPASAGVSRAGPAALPRAENSLSSAARTPPRSTGTRAARCGPGSARPSARGTRGGPSGSRVRDRCRTRARACRAGS